MTSTNVPDGSAADHVRTGARSGGAASWLAKALAVLDAAPLIDGHNDLPYAMRTAFDYDLARADIAARQPTLRTDIPRLREGRVGAQFWSAYVPSDLPEPEAVVATLEQIDFIHRLTRAHPETFQPARTAADVRDAFGAGRIASLIGLEGGHSIAGSLGVLRVLFTLGARYMTLTHNDNTGWADSATDVPRHGGLSDFGKSVVSEMNRLGMMVDLSHVSSQTMHDALDTTAAPVIFSHSCCTAICDSRRNVPDDVLLRLPDNGGVLMVALVPGFLSQARTDWTRELSSVRAEHDDPGQGESTPEVRRWLERNPQPPVTVADFADHIDHAREVAGIDGIGIGGDYDGCVDAPEGLEDVSAYPRLVAELLERGYSDSDLRKIIGANVLRVLELNEEVSRSHA
ncbi:dipeptidase [Spirillospora sp. NPDC049024]